MKRVHRDHGQDKERPPTVEERVRAARNLLSLLGRQERRRRGEPELQVEDGGKERAA